MAYKKTNENIVDLQNEDTEINLHFQDFGEDEGKERKNEQTLYFNTFPDSYEDDDQERKLIDDEESEGRPKSKYSFWTFEYYQQFFDVESKQVGDRIMWSMVPKPGVNYLQSYIRPNPDLYGPFWICLTLVMTTAIAGNLSSYLQSSEAFKWKYDFHKITVATSSIFSYAWLVPVMIWAVLTWRGSKANIALLELVCLYGYSLAIFVPVTLLWIIPLRWLQWCLGIVASVLSGSVLVRTIQPAVAHEAKKVAVGLALLVIFLHAALALGFMLYFFYPPVTAVQSTQAASLNAVKEAAANASKLNEKTQAKEHEQAKKADKEKRANDDHKFEDDKSPNHNLEAMGQLKEDEQSSIDESIKGKKVQPDANVDEKGETKVNIEDVKNDEEVTEKKTSEIVKNLIETDKRIKKDYVSEENLKEGLQKEIQTTIKSKTDSKNIASNANKVNASNSQNATPLIENVQVKTTQRVID